MSIILAGRFDTTVQVLAVLKDLRSARFGQTEFAGYYVNPPGRYGLYPLAAGKASAVAAGAQQGSRAVADGQPGSSRAAAMRGGDSVGAYMETLLDALNQRAGASAASAEPPATANDAGPEAGAGPMVAICVDRPGTEQIARATLHRHGAQAIERTEGRWEDGNWKDFDARETAAAA